MPNNQDTLVDKLEDIGDAIRAKTGKSDKLTLSQMPTEIGSISGGGGTDYLTYFNNKIKNATNSNLGDVALDFDAEYIPTLCTYGFGGLSLKQRITSLNIPNLKVINQYFLYGTSQATFTTTLSEWSFPSVTTISLASAIGGIGSPQEPINRVSFPELTGAWMRNAFQNHVYINSLYIPKLTAMAYKFSNQFWLIKNVYMRDVQSLGGTSTTYAMFGDTAVEKLVVDNTTPPNLNTYITNYAHNDANNRFYNGSAKIYVPRAALSDYENATNWSVYYAAGNILAIEDSETDLKGKFPQLDEKMGW